MYQTPVNPSIPPSKNPPAIRQPVVQHSSTRVDVCAPAGASSPWVIRCACGWPKRSWESACKPCRARAFRAREYERQAAVNHAEFWRDYARRNGGR